MIRIDNERLLVSGPLTLETVGELAAARLCAEQPVREIDLAGVDRVDSSAVALLLHWVRQIQEKKCSLSFANVPEDLRNLAALYDVADILALPAAGNPSD
ncbi:MAG: hypothetical protein Fur0026_14200 [Sideroxydans sp.]